MLFRSPGEKKKYLSMWNGYLDPEKEAYNETLAKSIGSDYEYLHTSGHCDMKSMREILRLLQPKAIIPIHTDRPDAFVEQFCDEWPVIRLIDGQSIEPTSTSRVDVCKLTVFCAKDLEDDTTCEDSEDGEQAFGLDAKFIGAFRDMDAAKFVMENIHYRDRKSTRLNSSH